MVNELANILNCDNIFQNEPLSMHSTFKIGGTCDYLLYPESISELTSLLKFLRGNSIPYYVIGNGSNILFSDSGFSGCLIKTSKLGEITVLGNIITSDSGVMLSKLCDMAVKHSLDGLVSLSGIPGTVGGAVYMNAGA